jgi:hypothetical protein
MSVKRRLQPAFESKASLDSNNSFLHETEVNSAIDEEIRRGIEAKFRLSKVNKSYHFPRIKQRPRKKGVLPSGRTDGLPGYMHFRERRQTGGRHLRASSELSYYSPYLAKTPDLR